MPCVLADFLELASAYLNGNPFISGAAAAAPNDLPTADLVAGPPPAANATQTVVDPMNGQGGPVTAEPAESPIPVPTAAAATATGDVTEPPSRRANKKNTGKHFQFALPTSGSDNLKQ